jgi:cell division protein FtsL
MKRRVKPAKPPSRLLAAGFAVAAVLIGFATLLVRLEVQEEGYRLSTLTKEIGELQEKNRSLKLAAAELGSRQRLRALADKYRMTAPARGQVVVVP